MVDKKTWKEFRESGLLWFINSILHLFGWAIVIELHDNDIISAYPARVKFRGFDEKTSSEGYKKISKYLSENINDLLEEAEDI